MSEPVAKRARRESTHPEPESNSASTADMERNFELSLRKMDIDELRDLIAAEAVRSPQVVRSVTEYFDISRRDRPVIDVEKFVEMLGFPLGTDAKGNITHLMSTIESFGRKLGHMVNDISHQTSTATKFNAIAALRIIGKSFPYYKSGFIPFRMTKDIVAGFERVLKTFNREEKKELLFQYHSLESLTNFDIKLPCDDDNPEWLQELIDGNTAKWVTTPYTEFGDKDRFFGGMEEVVRRIKPIDMKREESSGQVGNDEDKRRRKALKKVYNVTRSHRRMRRNSAQTDSDLKY